MLENAAWPEHRFSDATMAPSAVRPPIGGQSANAVIDEVRRALITAEEAPVNPRRWFGLLGKPRTAISRLEIVAQSQEPEIVRVGIRPHFNPID